MVSPVKCSASTRLVRVRILTAKEEEYNCSRVRDKQTSGLAAIIRKRTEITRLVMNEDYLHLVKLGLDDINDFKTNMNTCLVDRG